MVIWILLSTPFADKSLFESCSDPVLHRGFILLAPQQKLCRITLVGESEMHRGRFLPVWNLDAVSLGAGTITDKRQAVQGKR